MRRYAIAFLIGISAFAGCQEPQRAAAPQKPNVRVTNIPQNESGKRSRVVDPLGASLVDRMIVGTKLGADGAVAESRETIPEGEPVYLSLFLRDSPGGLRIGTIWYGRGGEKLAVDEKDMNGARVATFALAQKLPPGKYHVEGYWGASLAGDTKFEVVARSKKSK
jgi:hypothetical protein